MRIAAGAGLFLLLLVLAPAWASDPHALWQIVHGRCVPDQVQHGDPAPCARVDIAGGFAVLKDIRGAEQFLLIPTARIGGIESPALLRPGAPNYFAEAWAQSPLVEARLGRALPRNDVALAINSAFGRTQDQFHIHIDCISPGAQRALASQLDSIGTHWTRLRAPLAGHPYRALRIPGTQLGVNPFRLLAASLRDPDSDMGRHTLVLVGADRPEPGFILLDGERDLLHLDHASGEELQDHSCTVAHGVTLPPSAPGDAVVR